MNAKVIIHRPNLSKEEREYRLEQIKQSVINFHREVETNEKARYDRKTN